MPAIPAIKPDSIARMAGSYRTEARIVALQGCVSTGMCERKRSRDGLERALESHDRDDV